MDESDSETLSEAFDKCLKLHEQIKNSNESSKTGALQTQIRSCIARLERLTLCVSQAGLFSTNESLEELPTDSLKFLLLPFYLAELTVKLVQSDRIQLIARADVYFRDFIQRCNDYSVSDVSAPSPPDDVTSSAEGRRMPASSDSQPSMHSLAVMSRQREERISRFRRQKQLQNKLDQLQVSVRDGSASDDVARDYYCTLLQRCVELALDEIRSLQLEVPILRHMAELSCKDLRSGLNSDKNNGNNPDTNQLQSCTIDSATNELSLTPSEVASGGKVNAILLTRSRLESSVFGAGYSSLPTMTVEEFYRSRVADGTFRTPAQLAQSAAKNMSKHDPEVSKQELDTEIKERNEECDDEATLSQARCWDDYNDTHRRGEGNRHNRS